MVKQWRKHAVNMHNLDWIRDISSKLETEKEVVEEMELSTVIYEEKCNVKEEKRECKINRYS